MKYYILSFFVLLTFNVQAAKKDLITKRSPTSESCENKILDQVKEIAYIAHGGKDFVKSVSLIHKKGALLKFKSISNDNVATKIDVGVLRPDEDCTLDEVYLKFISEGGA